MDITLETIIKENILKYFIKCISTILLCTSSISVVFAEDEKGMSYTANLESLNNSGVYATVEITRMGKKKLHVSIRAFGLEVDKPHPQHIHGFDKPVKNATCPTLESDTNGDGIISIGEGVPAFGPIILPLVPFDLVDASGNIEYEATFTIKSGSLQPLHNRAIVLHGMTVNNQYIPSLPVACGEIIHID